MASWQLDCWPQRLRWLTQPGGIAPAIVGLGAALVALLVWALVVFGKYGGNPTGLARIGDQLPLSPRWAAGLAFTALRPGAASGRWLLAAGTVVGGVGDDYCRLWNWLGTGPMSFPVPILLIAFNRPANTIRVLDALRPLQPVQIFVAADGPRKDNQNDVVRCADVRRIFAEQIDWPCQVQTRFNSVNMGCRKGVEQAIDWFFDEVEEGIILEDDVVPTRDFFFYCQELLERHRFDQRIGSISGNCFLPKGVKIDESYYFSMYTHCWGWATWKRAWRCYDKDMLQWIDFRNCGWVEMLAGKTAADYWRQLIDQVYLNVVDTWDLVWLYSCWKSGFLTCVASVELIENIGFGLDATHTIDEVSPLDTPGILAFPLRHPSVWQSRRDFDVHTMKTHYHLSWVKKFSRKSRKLMRIIRGQLGHV